MPTPNTDPVVRDKMELTQPSVAGRWCTDAALTLGREMSLIYPRQELKFAAFTCISGPPAASVPPALGRGGRALSTPGTSYQSCKD